jgi:hypothetical protein
MKPRSMARWCLAVLGVHAKGAGVALPWWRGHDAVLGDEEWGDLVLAGKDSGVAWRGELLWWQARKRRKGAADCGGGGRGIEERRRVFYKTLGRVPW